MYLPAYSPELNPVELVFMQVKRILWDHCDSTIPLWADIAFAFGLISHTQILKYFERCLKFQNWNKWICNLTFICFCCCQWISQVSEPVNENVTFWTCHTIHEFFLTRLTVMRYALILQLKESSKKIPWLGRQQVKLKVEKSMTAHSAVWFINNSCKLRLYLEAWKVTSKHTFNFHLFSLVSFFW
jgi:hypothetical protein